MYVADVGPALAATGQPNNGRTPGTTPPAAQRFERTYAAARSGTYTNLGAYNSYPGSRTLQSYYPSANGLTASLVDFPSSLDADLSGATAEKAELCLHFEHWYDSSGGQAAIRTHGHAAIFPHGTPSDSRPALGISSATCP